MSADPDSAAPAAPARRRRSRGARIAIALVCALALLAVGTVAAVTLVQHRISSKMEYLDDPFDDLTDRPGATSDATADPSAADAAPVNILVLGSDSRISAGDPSQWEYGAQRTDAIMLVHIPADRSGVQVMSIPRDSWVSIPGYGEAKINAAFAFGGPSLLIETVEQLTGVRIDHVAVADFESFAELTDELGGVEIELPDGMNSRGVTLEPGTHTFTGDQALVYVRERYDLPRGDIDRVQRQQNWMRAIMRAAIDRGILTNPLELMSFLETAANGMAVDDGFTIATMRDLAVSMRDVRPGDVVFMTVPLAGTGTSADGQSIVNLDRPAFDALMAAVAADDVDGYLDEHPDEAEVLGSDVA